MKRILRYQLSFPYEENHFSEPVKLPQHFKILHFGYQQARSMFSIWAQVDDSLPYATEVRFMILTTGHEIAPGDAIYIGTCIMPDGFHVFHLFQLP